uniref:Fibronectin type-III domain-containing protein n=1 Tax=Macrostomum lignano TaxID=282301 RepID=A0A1I8IN22_9PLAT
VIKHAPTAVEIEFKKSRTPGVQSYTVSYREEASSTMNRRNWIQLENVPGNEPGDRVRTRVSSLRPHTKYQLKVDSVTANFSSKDNASNPIVEFMTLETSPAATDRPLTVTSSSET